MTWGLSNLLKGTHSQQTQQCLSTDHDKLNSIFKLILLIGPSQCAISYKKSMLDLLLAAWSKFLTSLINSLILLLVLSNSFSCECKESLKYGESCRHSVNSNGKSPMLDHKKNL